MTTPVGSDDAYPEQIATEFVRTTRNSEQEWKNRALAAELNLACDKRDAREVIGQLQKELDAARAEAEHYNHMFAVTLSDLQRLREAALPVLEYLEHSDMTYFVEHGNRKEWEVYTKLRDALRDTETHGGQ